jgi:iron(III) transport system substrate-binding protein
MSRRLLALFAVVGLAGALLAACSSGDDGDRLTVYSGRSQELVGPVFERFTQQTGIELDVRYGDSADLALLIATEGAKSPADVFFSQSPGAIGYLANAGLLQTLPDGVLDRVEPQYRGPDGSWVGVTGRARVLVYNSERPSATDLPDSVFDLTGPAYKGRVGLAPTNGSFQDFVTFLRAGIGDDATADWLNAMAANGARAYANNLAVIEAVGRGEVDFGLANHYYKVKIKAENPNSPTENHFFPDGDLGSLVLATGFGVLRSSGQADAARRLAEFLLSDAEQAAFAEETKEYPLVAGVAGPKGQPPIEEIPAPDADFTSLGAELRRTKELIGASGLANN